MAEPAPRSIVVIGIGNELRGDDGAGIEIARRLLALELPPGVVVRAEQGETTRLLAIWQASDAVVLVDTMRSGAAAGSVRRMDASCEPLPAQPHGTSSTHAFSLGETIELARALDQLPPTVLVYAVEGARFDAGAGLSRELKESLPALADSVLRDACALAAPTESPS